MTLNQFFIIEHTSNSYSNHSTARTAGTLLPFNTQEVMLHHTKKHNPQNLNKHKNTRAATSKLSGELKQKTPKIQLKQALKRQHSSKSQLVKCRLEIKSTPPSHVSGKLSISLSLLWILSFSQNELRDAVGMHSHAGGKLFHSLHTLKFCHSLV